MEQDGIGRGSFADVERNERLLAIVGAPNEVVQVPLRRDEIEELRSGLQLRKNGELAETDTTYAAERNARRARIDARLLDAIALCDEREDTARQIHELQQQLETREREFRALVADAREEEEDGPADEDY